MLTTTLLTLTLLSLTTPSQSTTDVCIIGSGIAGSSVAHFLRQYSSAVNQIRIFERHPVVGGRMATVTIAGETFEAGASILHPKNYHALNFTNMLGLKVKGPSASDSSMSLGIWDGEKFLFKTIDSDSKNQVVQYFVSFVNSIRMLFRYGVSLLKMNNFVEVVKRAGEVEDSDFVGPVPAAGVKRSVRDRLGSNVDAVYRDNKRHRGANGGLTSEASNGVDDTHLSKNDLRFKILKKSERKDKQKNVDLRDMLSRKARPSTANGKVHESMSEQRNSRQKAPELTPEQKDDRRCMPERKDGQWEPGEVGTRDDGRMMRDPIKIGQKDDRRLIWDSVEAGPRDDRRLIRDSVEAGPRDDRRLIRDSVEVGPRDDRRLIRDSVEVGPRDDQRVMRVPVEVGPRMHKLYDDRRPNLDPTDSSMPSRLASTRTSRTLSQMDLSKTSFSLETLDRISHSSQHRVLDNSAGLPPPPTEEALRRPLMRTLNDSRPVTYASGGLREISRPMATTSFPIKSAISDGPTKSVGLSVAPQLPMGRIVPQSQYPVEYRTVEGFLHSLGLDKYLISFKVEEVDMATLSQMGDHDLKEMSIPMGPRKKILLALARNRRPQ